jgi:GNAT superfamily N-acetyltransferase
MMFNDYYFHLRFRGGETELEDNDPSHYRYVTDGTVVGIDEADQAAEVGRFRLSYIDVCVAMNAKAWVFDIFDCTLELCDYYPAIFDMETEGPSPELTRLFKGDIWPGNVLIFDRLEILPEFRGHNLGLVVMRRLIERFGAGAGVVAIKPFPLQRECARDEGAGWRQKMRLGDFDKDFRRAAPKLRRHYGKLGFKLMKGTPFMFLAPPATLACAQQARSQGPRRELFKNKACRIAPAH